MAAGEPHRALTSAPDGGTVPDLVRPGLRLLFCGINPGRRSGELGQHFARPGNRFWPVLHRSGLTDRQLRPAEQAELLALGIGITNLVPRTTAAAAELSKDELRAGAGHLEAVVRSLAPATVAVLGILAYRTAFARPRAVLGRQPEDLGPAALWVLPNPSGAQARYQLDDLVEQFSALRRDVDRRAPVS